MPQNISSTVELIRKGKKHFGRHCACRNIAVILRVLTIGAIILMAVLFFMSDEKEETTKTNIPTKPIR